MKITNKKNNVNTKCPQCNEPLEDDWLISTGAKLMGARRHKNPPSPEGLQKMREVMKKNQTNRWGRGRKINE